MDGVAALARRLAAREEDAALVLLRLRKPIWRDIDVPKDAWRVLREGV